MSEALKPRWRWWLFCAALWLHFKTPWGWPLEVMGWSVLPGWVAEPGEARNG